MVDRSLWRNRRLQVVVAVVVLAAAGVGTGLALSGGGDPARLHAVSTAQAAVLAARSCDTLGAVRDLIDADGPAERVRALLRTAVSDATTAAFSDPRWVSLASNTQLMQMAIDNDNADAARQSVLGVQAECGRINK
jgi:hypothetical protein